MDMIQEKQSINAMVHPMDCQKGFKDLSNHSVSLILTDPPYFIDGMDDHWNHVKLNHKTRKNGVVGKLPVGMKFDPKQGKRLQKFMTPVAKECLRIIKPGGFFLCFTQNRLSHRMAISLENAGFEIRDMFVWYYEKGGQPKAFTQDHFVKKRKISEKEKDRLIQKLGGRKTAQLKPESEFIILAQAPKEGTYVDNWDRWETGLIDVSNPYINQHKFPSTVMPCDKNKEKIDHMTVKPIDLLRHLIRIFSIEGSLVLDPFSGSGSTGVACLLENRNYVGFEIDRQIAVDSQKRINEYL